MKQLTILHKQGIMRYLWFAVCLGVCLDTELFVYLSLSQTLVGGLFILLFLSFGLICSWRQPFQLGYCSGSHIRN